MALVMSDNTRIASARAVKEPNLVLCIDGYDKCFGSGIIREVIRIGDPDLYVGNDWLIGGIRVREDQITAISIDGSSTTVRQQMDIDKARGSSIQSMQIELVDIDQQITELISPSVLIDDVLGKKAVVYLAIDNSSSVWPDDYEILFRGNIDDIKTLPASIIFNIAHPEQKKKQTIWPRAKTELAISIGLLDTTIDLVSTADFLLSVPAGDASIDPDFRKYVIIGDEAILYTAYTGNQLTGCVRGQLGTPILNHTAGAAAASLYRLTGDVMSIALKIMMSKQDYYLTDIPITNFNVLHAPDSIPNALYFEGFDARRDYGYMLGDYITVTGSANAGSNDVTLREIITIERTEFGSYIVLDGVTFVDEVATNALMSIRSKYDVWPAAMGMGGDEVDVLQHESIRQTYLSGFVYDCYVKDTIEDGREFVEQEIYKPAAAASVPRSAKASVTLMQSPIPSLNSVVLNSTNIISPDKIQMRRTITKQFANTIVYKIDEDPVSDKFLRGDVTVSATSLARIKVGTKAMVITSKALRSTSNGIAQAQLSAQRRINRYEFGAEYFEGIQVTFGVGWSIEVGDVVVLDGSALHIANTADGTRVRPAMLVEVQNKSLNYKTGEVKLDLVNTNFNGQGKYALIGAASKIKTGIDQQTFVIEQFYTSIYGTAEYQKWYRYGRPAVVIRSPDGVTRSFQTIITDATSNTITVRDALGFVPQAGDIMELANHDFVDTTGEIKLLYGFMSPLNGGAVDPYQMI